MGGFFTGVKFHRRDAETLRRTRCGKEIGGIAGVRGLRLYTAGPGVESAETAEIAETEYTTGGGT